MTLSRSTWQHILSSSTAFAPQESLMPVSKHCEQLLIGIPKEHSLQEKRICLTPSSVAMLTDAGHRVHIEREAARGAKYDDNAYRQAGAEIVENSREALGTDIILKVEPPTLDEIKQMKTGSLLISALQVGYQNATYIEHLNQKRITALSFELFRDEQGLHSIQRALGEIAGSLVIFIAAEYLSTSSQGLGVVLGSIPGLPPTRIVLLGSGTVAESAARVALGLGADIQIFDNAIYRLRRLRKSLGRISLRLL